MNYKSISYILGWIMKVEGVFLLLPLAVSLLYREKTWPVFLACALLSFIPVSYTHLDVYKRQQLLLTAD